MVPHESSVVNLNPDNIAFGETNSTAGIPQQFGAATNVHPAIVITINEIVWRISIDELRQHNSLQNLVLLAAQPQTTIFIDLQEIFEFESSGYYDILNLLKSLSAAHDEANAGCSSMEFVLTPDSNPVQFEGLFQAIIEIMQHVDSPLTSQRSWELAITAALVLNPDCTEAAISRVQSKLKQLGVSTKAFKVSESVKRLQAQRQAAVVECSGAQLSVKAILQDCPFDPSHQLPPGYSLTVDGTIHQNSDGELVAYRPTFVSKHVQDHQSELQHVELVYKDQNHWRRRVVPRCQIANAHSIIELSAFGVSVDSSTATLLVRFLSAYEQTNSANITTGIMTQQLGWIGTGGSNNSQFLLGNCAIVKSSSSAPDIQYFGADKGEEQYAQGFAKGGDYASWQALMQHIVNKPKLRFMLYASFAAPLLRLLNVPSFVVDLAGNTTLGKTIALRLAASVWGNPNETQTSIMQNWNMTAVAIERRLSSSRGLPLFLDDSQHCSDPDLIKRVIYATDSGRGRGRGTRSGTTSTATFETVLFSSGETPLTSFNSAGGQHTRVLSLWGSPFGENTLENAQLAQCMDDGCRMHFGHAGQFYIQALINAIADWQPRLQQHFTESKQSYLTAPHGGLSLLPRVAKLLAAVDTAAWLVHQFGILPFAYHDVVQDLLPILAGGSTQHDVAQQALHEVWDWYIANPDKFPLNDRTISDQYQRECFGFRLANDRIGFMKSLLEQKLTELGHHPKAILRSWRDREWLIVNAGSRNHELVVRVRGAHTRLITLPLAVFEAVNTEGEGSPTEPLSN